MLPANGRMASTIAIKARSPNAATAIRWTFAKLAVRCVSLSATAATVTVTAGVGAVTTANVPRQNAMNSLRQLKTHQHVSMSHTFGNLEYDLQKALEEVQTLKATCPDCPTCADPPPAETPEETPEPEKSSSKTVTLYRMPNNTRWNWEGSSNPSTEFMRQHLMDEHGIDASMMTRDQMQLLHNNAHNYGDDKAFGFPTEFNSSVTAKLSCGNCPTLAGFFWQWRWQLSYRQFGLMFTRSIWEMAMKIKRTHKEHRQKQSSG